MRAGSIASAFGAGLLALATTASVAKAERLLVQHADLLVVADREAACGEPIPITLRAAEAGFFDDSEKVQRTVDGIRAMLGFECAKLPRLDLTGEAGRDQQVVFRGVAGDETKWLVERRDAPSTASVSTGSAGGPLSSGTATGDPVAMREIAGVHLGMTVEEAMNGAAGSFDQRPVYKEQSQLLQAMDGGCDFRFADGRSPKAGWRCLEGGFSATSEPRLQAIGLAQAIDQDQRDSIEKRLVERFGEPEETIRRDDSDGNGGHPFLYLAWDDVLSDQRGDRLPFVDAPLRKLEAYAEVRNGLTVVTIWHQDPQAVAEVAPEYRLKF